jgi:DNA invertase Pin-like site-specific DNA recombinase
LPYDIIEWRAINKHRSKQSVRVILYARVSTEDQAKDGVSLEAQAAKMAAYASLYDLEAIATITDAGESAKSLNRPGLQKALTMLRSGTADGLVICKLDRLTRSVADWQQLIDGYFGERAGKQLFSVGDSIDTRTAAGRMVLNILLSVAQWEREAIGERTRDALRHKIRRRERCGKVRFGYDLADDGKTLVPNVDEQAVIGLMADLRGRGHTLREIADALTARGIRTKEAKAAWTHTAVRRILHRAA